MRQVARTRLEATVAAELRGRIAWYWLPAAALAAATFAYGLHHALPLDGHGFTVAVVVVVVSVALVVVAGLMARPAERLLPIVVAAERPRELRTLRAEDAGFCAAVHAATLDHGFFVALGHGFLRAYYLSFVGSPHAVAFVAAVDGVPVGMIVGTIRPQAHARWVVRRRGVRFVARGLAVLLVRPRVALRFARTRLTLYRGAWRRLRARAPAPPQRNEKPVAVLSHVAVVPGAQDLGVGVELTLAFVRAATERGAGAIALHTLAGDAGASGFYQRLGWQIEGRVATRDGRRMLAMKLDLPRRP